MYLYDIYDLAVNLFNGSMEFMRFMFTPLNIAGFSLGVPPIYFFGFGTLTVWLVIAIAKWVI